MIVSRLYFRSSMLFWADEDRSAELYLICKNKTANAVTVVVIQSSRKKEFSILAIPNTFNSPKTN